MELDPSEGRKPDCAQAERDCKNTQQELPAMRIKGGLMESGCQAAPPMQFLQGLRMDQPLRQGLQESREFLQEEGRSRSRAKETPLERRSQSNRRIDSFTDVQIPTLDDIPMEEGDSYGGRRYPED